MNKESNIFKNIITVLLTLLILGLAAGTASAFSFQGYTYNETNATLNNTNVSIEIYTMGGPFGPTLLSTNYTSSDASGYFNIWINGSMDNPSYMYKPVLKHFENNATTGTLDWIGQSLPQFPYQMISSLTVSSPMNFYLRKGGTIYINASGLNQSQIVVPFAFKYVIKDTRMGYPVAQNFSADQLQVGPLYVPLERNYSIMIFPNQSLPVSYDLNNLSTYTNHIANITFNTSIRPLWVSGYANLSDGTSNFTDFKIIAYQMEPGNMIGKDHPMPSNMSAFRGPGFSDNYTASTGFYNITLPGSAQGAGANIFLFATAFNNSNSEYYGAFKNITMSYSGSNQQNFNFTLYPLLGNPENISVNDMGLFGQPRNITTKMLPFQLINGSSSTNITNSSAHIEMQVNYSANGSAAFKWMLDVSQTDEGSFSIPAISAPISKINVFMQDFAPKKTSKNTTQLATWPVNITMNSFENKKPDGGQLSGIKMDMLMSKPECDLPNPAPGCSLVKAQGLDPSEFNPFKVVMGGGKISLRIKQTSTNITVHYKNVDMLASGPPDVLFEDNASSSQSGTALERAWRFGSNGPEIYDEVLIGIPLGTVIPNNISVKLGTLYDENWNTIWNISAGGTGSNLPSEYSTFNTSWFNSTGMPCSTTDQTAPCYLDVIKRKVWLTIPHFSGVGPAVLGTAGNFTATLTNSTGIAGGSVTMNFSMNDTSNATSWYNITFPSGFDASGAIVNISINNSADPLEWTKNNSAGFVNVSSGTVSANFGVNQYINISNITLPQTAGNKTINVTTNNGVTVSLNYTVTTNGTNLTIIGSSTQSVSVNTNATYTFSLQNNGSLTDNYTISVSNPNNAITGLNITSPVMIVSGATRIFTLNVSNASAGTFPVNITANSTNDPSKVGIVNTTTTVTGGGGGGGVTEMDACGAISGSGKYVLNMSINGDGISPCITINSSDVIFDGAGFTIDGWRQNGVYVHNASITLTNVTVKNLMVTNSSEGIYYQNVDNGNIRNNTASSNQYGIYLNSSNSNNITDNTANLNSGGPGGVGVYLISSSNNTLTNNTASSNANFGIRLQSSNSSTISRGSVNSNGHFGVVVLTSNYVNVTGVEIFNNTDDGLRDEAIVAESYQNFSYNNISGSNYGIYLVGEDNSTIKGNRIWNNSYGIYLTSSNDNTIYNNNFNNTNNSYDDGNNTWNTTKTVGTNIVDGQDLGGNFWSDYNGVDTDGDGLGNTLTPYNSSGNITNGGDYLPLLAPIVVTITYPDNNSVNDTGYVNVTVTLDRAGTARLNWNGVNESMDGAGTSFYKNKTGLLSGNHRFKIYANDSSYAFRTSVSETRIVTVNRTTVDTTIGTIINTSTFITNATLEIAAPSGNVTVTIPNGTNASVGGIALTSISADSLAQVNSTFVANLGSNDKLVGENLSLGPEGAIFSPAIQIQFNYTPEMLTAAGISASELRVKFYNTTTNTWDVQTPYSLNETGKYITANVSHFSTFALLGTTTTTSSNGGSSGGSSGGGGVVSGESFGNIAKSESYDKDLVANTPITYTFKTPGLDIYEIAFTDKENENGITLRVEALKGTSTQVTTQPPGTVYKNINIIAGTSRMKEALIRFRVENSWLGSNSLAGSDVKMLHWDGSQWTQLETVQTTKDDTYTYYEAKTDSLSPFAISGIKGGVLVPTATPVVTETQAMQTGTGTPSPSPTKKVPGFEFVLTVGILSVAYLFGRKRR